MKCVFQPLAFRRLESNGTLFHLYVVHPYFHNAQQKESLGISWKHVAVICNEPQESLKTTEVLVEQTQPPQAALCSMSQWPNSLQLCSLRLSPPPPTASVPWPQDKSISMGYEPHGTLPSVDHRLILWQFQAPY